MSRKVILITIGVVAGVVLLWVAAIAIHMRRPSVPLSAGTPVPMIIPARDQPTIKSASLGSPSPSPTPMSKDDAKGQIAVDYKWTKGGFDNIMLVDFTFSNPTPYSAKDITVTCTHYAPSGTEIDSNTRTIYEVVPANGKKKVIKFNMGFIHSQASSSRCSIVDLSM